MQTKLFDCIIIGGGIGGLTAGIYLSRFLINFKIFDDQQSRALTIPRSHNYPSFPNGISGKAIIKRLKKQYQKYGPPITHTTVTDLRFDAKKKLFKVITKKNSYTARFIILATGGRDIQPDVPNIKKIIQKRILRHCLVCDAYEAKNQKIGVLGYGNEGFKTAFVLKKYSDHVVFFDLNCQNRVCLPKFSYILQTGIQVITEPIIDFNSKKTCVYIKTEHKTFVFDTVYSALGTEHRSSLAIRLGAKLTAEKCIITDKNNESSVPGLFAIGDVSSCLKQMCVAESQAAVVAHHIFLQLYSVEPRRK